MNNLLARILTGVIGVVIVVGVIRYSYRGLWLFGFVVSGVCLWEFLRGVQMSQPRYSIPVLSAAGLIWMLNLLPISPTLLIGFTMLLLPLFEIIFLFYPKATDPPQQIGLWVLGFFYCLIPLLLYYEMSVPDNPEFYDFHIPLGILILTWSLDTSAFIVGKTLGRHQLYPRISPKKTWEGAVGGATGCLFAGWLLMQLWPVDIIPNFNWMYVAGIVGVFSQLGDLVESMFKRSMQLKDSGNILPGHGGMLDRFDGFMLAMPFVYFYYILL